jgi:hypothetical protein
METKLKVELCISTNIEIKDINGKSLCKTSNTITNQGKNNLHKIMSSTSYINNIAFSYLNNVGLPIDATMFTDAVIKEISSTYYSTSEYTGEIIMNFESYVKSLPVGTLKRLGLAIGSDILFSVANTGDILVGDTPIIVSYQLKIKLNQGA